MSLASSSEPVTIACSFTQSFRASPLANAMTLNSQKRTAIGQPIAGRIESMWELFSFNQLLEYVKLIPNFLISLSSESVGEDNHTSPGCRFNPKGISSP